MPRASVRIAVKVKPGDLRSWRIAKRMSWRRECIDKPLRKMKHLICQMIAAAKVHIQWFRKPAMTAARIRCSEMSYQCPKMDTISRYPRSQRRDLGHPELSGSLL